MNSCSPFVLLQSLSRRRSSVRIAGMLLVIVTMTASAEAGTTISFRLVHRFAIIVQVRINDNGPYDFLLDTGTNTSMISSELAEGNALRIVDTACLHTVAGAQVVPRGYLDRITLGNQSASVIEVLAANISAARMLDSNIVGILGINFLKRFNFTIDYDTHQINFDDETDNKIRKNGQHHAIENVDGIFIVKAAASSSRETLRMVLDSGGQNVILFAATPQHLFGGGGQNEMSWTTVFTNTGNQKLFTGRLRLLRIGNAELANVTAMVTSIDRQESQQPIDGLLPTSLFHRVYFNYTKGYVVFDPAKQQ
jgi:predicted aspartyl protease